MVKKFLSIHEVTEGWGESSFDDVKGFLRPEILNEFDLPPFSQFGMNLLTMANFYSFLKPLLHEARPELICEIGANEGNSTKAWLEICRESGSALHVVDPIFKESCDEVINGVAVSRFAQTSLTYLSNQERPADIYFIDGDHNHYTLISELRAISALANNNKRRFPLLVLHDTNWPCSVRDAFYNLDSVSPSDRPVVLDETELSLFVMHEPTECGFTSHLPWSLPKSLPSSPGRTECGLKSAVEVFLEENPELRALSLPSLYGVTIITDHDCEKGVEFQRLSKASEVFSSFFSILELNRLYLLERSHFFGKKSEFFSNKVRELWESSVERITSVDRASLVVKRFWDQVEQGEQLPSVLFVGTPLTFKYIRNFLPNSIRAVVRIPPAQSSDEQIATVAIEQLRRDYENGLLPSLSVILEDSVSPQDSAYWQHLIGCPQTRIRVFAVAGPQ